MRQIGRTLEQHFWVVKAAATVAAAGLLASALSAYVGARIVGAGAAPVASAALEGDADEDGESAEADGDAPKRVVAGKRPRQKLLTRGDSPTLAHNPFCPTCLPPGVDEGAAPEGPAGALPPGPAVAFDGRRSELPLLLVATMEALDPENSRATLQSQRTGGTSLVWPGSQIAAGVEVLGIERGRVLLVNNGLREYIPIGEEPPKPAAKASPKDPAGAKPNKPAKPRAGGIPGAEDAIKCDGGGHSCTVERSFVDGLLKNPMQAATQIRVMPAQRDGEAYGFRLGRVRPGTLPQLLGLETGDVVLAVNGYELNSIDGAMSLLGKLRRASNLEVSIERKGRQLTKAVTIE